MLGSSKPIAFRPSPKALDIIKDEETKNPKKKRAEIINELIESAKPSRSEQPQPKGEEPSSTKTPFSQPPPSQIWILCPSQEKIISHHYCQLKCPQSIDCHTYGVFAENFDFELGCPKAPSTKKEE